MSVGGTWQFENLLYFLTIDYLRFNIHFISNLCVLEPFYIVFMVVGGSFTLFDTWWPHLVGTFQLPADPTSQSLVGSDIACIICLHVSEIVLVPFIRFK